MPYLRDRTRPSPRRRCRWCRSSTTSPTSTVGSGCAARKSETSGCNWSVPEEQARLRQRGTVPRGLDDPPGTRKPTTRSRARSLCRPRRTLRRWCTSSLTSVFRSIRSGDATAGWRSTLLSSYTTGEKVIIGHANGVITIDLVESLDDYRESLRVRLGEPYRTMLGHFRHEVGHYYQNMLGRNRLRAQIRYLDDAARCSATNEPATATRSRGTTSSAHRTAGKTTSSPSTPPCIRGRTSPSASPTTCTSPTPSTPAAKRAWCLHADRVRFSAPRDIVPLESYVDVPIERMLFDWRWMSLFFNRVNTAMGKNPAVSVRDPRARRRQARLRPPGDPRTARVSKEI